MAVINTINEAVSSAVNKESEEYTAIIGKEDFTPEAIISESSDFNCGGMSNELEYARRASEYQNSSFDIELAEEENLDALVTAFVDLPRRNRSEVDSTYRKRYRSLVNAKTNYRRMTRWAIIDAILEFGLLETQIQIVEKFDTSNLYFEIRVEGAVDFETAVFMNNPDSAYFDQNYVGGAGVGEVISYLGSIISRIKAAGVDFDVIFIAAQTPIQKSIDAFIGRVQRYLSVDAVIKASVSVSKNISAEIV